ncbi:MAG TPA: CPBP family intramembrane glutamic endopeptidase [Actinomycetes bacterium]|nr:CPBP family intramembrane glutamic endopeptidase [Actinomycetes bacterium]
MLVFAFLPGLPGLLLLVLGAPEGSSGGIDELTPAIVFGLIDLAFAWGPVVLLAYLLARRGEGLAAIGLDRFRASDAGMGAVLWVASWVLVYVVGSLLSGLGSNNVDFLPEALPLWFRIVDALVIAVTAGVTEEMVVRGYAQTRLEQLRAPTAVVIVLPTALWGLLHLYQGLGPALTIFCLGLVYAIWFHATRRLWPLIIAHVLFDLTQLALVLLLR